MAPVLEALDTDPLVLHLQPGITMTEDQFFEFCQINRFWRIERTAQGDILIMSPVGGGGSTRNAGVSAQLWVWAERDGSGVAFESSAGFTLPNGAMRSPDAAWVRNSRLENITAGQWEKFLPLCPDFVAEVRSATDRLSTLKGKMLEYLENGALLGWLIDPQKKHVYVYRPHAEVQSLEAPATLSGDPELPGFVLELRRVWDPRFPRS